MLPIANLDNQMFRDIVENARKMIPKFYPQWTDFNYHDPGITFIELFAWLKEIQQYHLDQIGERNQQKFLKLFGMELRHIVPAAAQIHIYNVENGLALPQGTRFSADGIIFETVKPEILCAARIADVFCINSDKTVGLAGEIGSSTGTMHFPIFGREPLPEDEFYIGFDTSLPVGTPISMYINIFDDYPVPRNPIGEADFAPLADLRWDYYTTEGWKPMTMLRDQSMQFIVSGTVSFILPEPMERLQLESENYWIRVTVMESNYEVPPILNSINLNMVEVRQQETLSAYQDFIYTERSPVFTLNTWLAMQGSVRVYAQGEENWQEIRDFTRQIAEEKNEVLLVVGEEGRQKLTPGCRVRVITYEGAFVLDRQVGEGDGFPYQSFELDLTDVVYDSFHIMVAEDEEEACLTEWHKVADFDASTPTDRHYVFNDQEGRIIFGDCEHGLAPEGRILLVGCVRSLGRSGNIKEGKITRFADGQFPQAGVINYDHAYDGDDIETIEQGFRRFKQSLHRIQRAITYEDYEDLTRITPGLMIKNCKAIPVNEIPYPDGSVDENCVSVVVQPFTIGDVQKLNPAYIENIYRQLGDRHLIGTRINVLSPEYVGIEVLGEIAVKPYYRDALQRISDAVDSFFSGTAWDFGAAVQYSTIYGIIDTLDCVSAILSLTINAQGKGITRSVNGDVLLPPNGLVYLKQAQYFISEIE